MTAANTHIVAPTYIPLSIVIFSSIKHTIITKHQPNILKLFIVIYAIGDAIGK